MRNVLSHFDSVLILRVNYLVPDLWLSPVRPWQDAPGPHQHAAHEGPGCYWAAAMH